jgi:hypothetical protein
LSATQAIAVVVRDVLSDVTLSAGGTNLLAGERVTLPLVLNSTLDLADLGFVVETDGQRLANLAVQADATEVLSVQVTELDSGRIAVSLRLDPAARTAANRTIAVFGFNALTGRGSAVVPVIVSQLQAARAGGGAVANTATQPGRVIVVEREPVLLLNGAPSPVLTLFGVPGRGYALLAAASLDVGTAWPEFHRVVLSGRSTNVSGAILPAAPSFFRALEVTGNAPRLELLYLGGNVFALRVEGSPGAAYVVQSATNVAAGWSNLTSLVLTNPVGAVFWTNGTEAQRFFRARTP